MRSQQAGPTHCQVRSNQQPSRLQTCTDCPPPTVGLAVDQLHDDGRRVEREGGHHHITFCLLTLTGELRLTGETPGQGWAGQVAPAPLTLSLLAGVG